MNIEKAFGIRLKQIRKTKDISQETLAEFSGLHRTYISSLERGGRNPTLTTLQSLANALEVDIRYLVQELDD